VINSDPLFFSHAPPGPGSQLSQDSEVFEDLKQLCATFRNTERFTILAASLHRKFIRSPRLSREILTDYNNFYLLKVGNGAVEDDIPKVNYLRCPFHVIVALMGL